MAKIYNLWLILVAIRLLKLSVKRKYLRISLQLIFISLLVLIHLAEGAEFVVIDLKNWHDIHNDDNGNNDDDDYNAKNNPISNDTT